MHMRPFVFYGKHNKFSTALTDYRSCLQFKLYCRNAVKTMQKTFNANFGNLKRFNSTSSSGHLKSFNSNQNWTRP